MTDIGLLSNMIEFRFEDIENLNIFFGACGKEHSSRVRLPNRNTEDESRITNTMSFGMKKTVELFGC